LGALFGRIVPYHVLRVVVVVVVAAAAAVVVEEVAAAVVVVVNIKHLCNDGRWWTTEDWRKICHCHLGSGSHQSGFSCLDRFLAFVVSS
jgi:hypothetical protein